MTGARLALFAFAFAMTAFALTGCARTVGEGEPDIDAARDFAGYPLYWVGPHFEKWDLEHVEVANGQFSTFIYGTCKVEDYEGGCAPPLQIQIQPLCTHLEVVARAPIWKRRRVRGSPVGTIDSAPVLFTNRVQVKVYRGQGSDPGLPMRALRALRSANDVEPVMRQQRHSASGAGRACRDAGLLIVVRRESAYENRLAASTSLAGATSA